MTIILNDYNEESVITPKIWFEESGLEKKVKELKSVKKFVITFPYLKNFIDMAKLYNFKEIEWYPNLGIFEYKGEKIGFFISRAGAPAISMDLEELIYIGGKFFILVGGVGVLDNTIKRGDIIIPDGAIRDEGTSYHYFPPEKEVYPSKYLYEKLKNLCKSEGLKFYEGKVWTTDAIYRETSHRIREFRKKGAICVDMEASACFAVSNYRNVELAAIFYGGDHVGEEHWSFRKEDLEKSKESEKTLFRVVCKALKEVKL